MPMVIEGLNELVLDMDELAELPDDVLSEMLYAGAEIVTEAHRSKVQSIGLVETGQLRDSISSSSKIKRTKNTRSVDIYPQGTREDGVRNAEVGFIYEYGAPGRGIAARQWMRAANEQAEDAAGEAAEAVYDNYLRSKNLL